MSDGTHIEWTDATWNPITGCAIVSPGCTNCYAMKLAGTRLKHIPSRVGLTRDTKAGPVWTGAVRFNEEWLDQPIKWKRPRRIFVCAHGDLFAEGVPDQWIDRVFAVMALCPQHTFQVLTKRPLRMRDYLLEQWQPAAAQTLVMGNDRFDMPAEEHGEDRRDQVARELEELLIDKGFRKRFADLDNASHWTDGGDLKAQQFQWPLANVWLGTSIEDQKRADERIPLLLDTPAAVRFISAEPLLGQLDIGEWLHDSDCEYPIIGLGTCSEPREDHIDWVIVGGESGPGARPMHPDWARSLRDQCQRAGVAFFFKQWGAWSVNDYDRDQDDPDWRRCDVVARETPDGQWLNLAGGQGFHGDRVVRAVPVGKKAAGRQLDGVEHNGMPGQ